MGAGDVRNFMNRREFLSSAGLAVAFHSLGKRGSALAAQVNSQPAGKADYTMRIEPCTLAQYLFNLRIVVRARDCGYYNVRHKSLSLRYAVRSENRRT